jgi:TRAP-type C4-dicarboxylate transport system permease large subunit
MAVVYRATLPVRLILLAGVLLITYVPALTMWPIRWLGL